MTIAPRRRHAPRLLGALLSVAAAGASAEAESSYPAAGLRAARHLLGWMDSKLARAERAMSAADGPANARRTLQAEASAVPSDEPSAPPSDEPSAAASLAPTSSPTFLFVGQTHSNVTLRSPTPVVPEDPAECGAFVDFFADQIEGMLTEELAAGDTSVEVTCVDGVCPPCEEGELPSRRRLLTTDTVVSYAITRTLGSAGGDPAVIEQEMQMEVAEAMSLDLVSAALETPEAQEQLGTFTVGMVETEITGSDDVVVSASPTSSSVPTDSSTYSPTVSSTYNPTAFPTDTATMPPTSSPTVSPTDSPSASPTLSPVASGKGGKTSPKSKAKSTKAKSTKAKSTKAKSTKAKSIGKAVKSVGKVGKGV